MEAGCCGLSDHPQAGDTGSAIQFSLDTTNEVMSAGSYGDRIASDVDIECAADARDRRELLMHITSDPAQIEVNMGITGLDHLFEDGAADNVSRGKICHGVRSFHEALPVSIPQYSTGAPDDLGDECASGTREVEGGGVELHEFHTHESSPCTEAQGDAIACRSYRVGGFAEYLAGTSGGDDDSAG